MLKKIIAVALKAGHVFQTSEELAARAAKSVRYSGGYLHSGETWSLSEPGSASQNKQELQGLRHFVKDYDHGGHEESDTAHNLGILNAAKIGDVLTDYISLNGSIQGMEFTKTREGWICTLTEWCPSNPNESDKIWSAADEVEKEAQRHAKALAKAKARANAEAEHHAMYSLEARAHLRMA